MLLTAVAEHLGPLRLPFLLLSAPVLLVAALLDSKEGRVLEGDVIRPTFSLPYAFQRGPWKVAEHQTYECALLELDGAKLEISLAAPVHRLRDDDVSRRLIEEAQRQPANEHGMRWAGLRMTTFMRELTCLYHVWCDERPNARTVMVKFTVDPAHEPAADAFVQSAMRALPKVEDVSEPSDESAQA